MRHDEQRQHQRQQTPSRGHMEPRASDGGGAALGQEALGETAMVTISAKSETPEEGTDLSQNGYG